MFSDRTDAGCRLALALGKYKDKKVLVLAIPRGGVEVAYQVATYLNADFSILVSRKLPFPDNPEAGFGAIAEDGSIFIFPYAASLLTQDRINRIIEEQKKELSRRIKVLRGGQALPEIKNKTVILVDDGVAMGSTMRVSIMLCKNKRAKRIIVASPVASPDVAGEITGLVDEAVFLETPEYFRAVADAYMNWYDVPDSEVIDIMQQWARQKHTSLT